jgi:hypothetical protein
LRVILSQLAYWSSPENLLQFVELLGVLAGEGSKGCSNPPAVIGKGWSDQSAHEIAIAAIAGLAIGQA